MSVREKETWKENNGKLPRKTNKQTNREDRQATKVPVGGDSDEAQVIIIIVTSVSSGLLNHCTPQCSVLVGRCAHDCRTLAVVQWNA